MSDEFLCAQGGLGLMVRLHIPWHNITVTAWDEPGGTGRDLHSQIHLSYAKAPLGLQDGEHLSVAKAAIYPTRAKTNSEPKARARKNIDTHLQGKEEKQRTQM